MKYPQLPKEWKLTRLYDLSIIKGQYGLNKPAIELDNQKPIYIRITDINEDGGLVYENLKSVDSNMSDDYRVEKDDILLARTGASTGKVYIHSELADNFTFAGFLVRFRVNKDLAFPKYIYYQLRSTNFKKWIKIMSMRSGQPGINSKEYGSYSIGMPSFEEQKKIANILATWDRVIELKNKEYYECISFKKTLVNRMFNNCKFWDNVNLGQLCKIVTGKKDSNEMNDVGPFKFFTCAKEDYLIDHYAFDTEALVIAGNGDIGHIKYYKGKFNAYQRTYVLYDFNVDIMYIKAFMDYKFVNQVEREKQMGAMPYIKLGTLVNFKIPIPNHKTRKMIVDVMSRIDLKEKLLMEELINLKLQKKGLMQQLLTGKIRVQP